jgi:hypothetical protein
MRYTKITPQNYESANEYYVWLLRYSTTYEQENERMDLAELLNDYEEDNFYSDKDLAD